MQVLHGTWIPRQTDDYQQDGGFYLWVETDKRQPDSGKNMHPEVLKKDNLIEFLVESLDLKHRYQSERVGSDIVERHVTLPTVKKRPLKSYEFMRFSEVEIPDAYTLKTWKIHCYRAHTPSIFKLLKEMHFLFSYSRSETQMGSDLIFWYHFTYLIKKIILKDRYIPAMKYQELPRPKNKRRKKYDSFKIHPAWEIVFEEYESQIEKIASKMPWICVAASEKPLDRNEFYSKVEHLRHFSENVLIELIRETPMTNQFDRQVGDAFLYDCIHGCRPVSKSRYYSTKAGENDFWKTEPALDIYKKWVPWNENLRGHHIESKFAFCFKLEEAVSNGDHWKIRFQIRSKVDPSLRIDLGDYWQMNKSAKTRLKKDFGAELEKKILMNLGHAARIYPKIWEGLETDRPALIHLNLEEAFQFLKESSWILQESDYKVIVPAWWTPKGRRKAKIRLKTSVKKQKGAGAAGKSFFGLHEIVQYHYELAIGDQVVTPKEWNDLVNAKSPLVKFRGEWMELDQEKMNQMLEFWENHGREKPEISVLDLMKLSADEAFEFDHDDVLMEMMGKLRDKNRFEVIENPETLNGELREYQKRGVSWIQYLEILNLNGCLADDMGLGKTIQVIARLIKEREEKETVPPTLLIVPTSVIGNWYHEISRFAPHLKALIHHGSERCRDKKEFSEMVSGHDAVISSYALARRDEKLFQSVNWERIVLDEAQNIKNPKAAQTKAILKIEAKHRFALTGTPVENRLMDLWSIFNFLNPGYLETQAGFRKAFELPIQKENDVVKTKILKNLVEPFILRRVKTDKEIIKDLPDKVEQKTYCNLSKEQASLYEAVVKDVLEKIEESAGIQRKGLILSSLMKLKQICNHPAQFLQDNSEFAKERSNKLSRLVEMVEEALESGESAVIFSQFREICESLDRYIRENLHYNTYLLHGGTARKKRDRMIQTFQDAETEPSIFILSLKAGGLGITLTKANHVFHFDRWWNPAVEDQATDRTFRIGQKKNVFVHKFVSMGTLEERIDQMIEEKKRISGAVIGSDESWLTELDNDAFRKLISLNKETIWG